MNYTIPNSITERKDLFKYLKENKGLLISQKKSADKYADAVHCKIPTGDVNDGLFAKKDIYTGKRESVDNSSTIIVKAAINTTNLLDSHSDVHIPGLWKKSLSETKEVLHLREHKMSFENVISRDVVATAKNMSWSSLGFEYDGSTQVLLFESKITRKEHNAFMIDQYLEGSVTNHSVGMRYVDIFLCINSTDKYYREEKDNWDKYYPQVANKSDADELGYFWAVTTAKLIEGSAVLRGSNYATPTISITEAGSTTSEKIEPSFDTQKQINIIKQIKF